MPPMIHEVSTLSARGQVTIPKPIRQVLGVDAGARLSFEVLDDQRVVLVPAVGVSARAAAAEESAQQNASGADESYDPALGPFLGLLDKDIDAGRVRDLPKDLEKMLLRRRGRPINLDEELIGEVALG